MRLRCQIKGGSGVQYTYGAALLNKVGTHFKIKVALKLKSHLANIPTASLDSHFVLLLCTF